jgi:hypothetical protein
MPWYAGTIILALMALSAWLYLDRRKAYEERAGFMREAGKEKKEACRLAGELSAQLALTTNLLSAVRSLRGERETQGKADAQTFDDYKRQLTDARRARDLAQKEVCYAADERDRARAELAEVRRRAALVLRQWAENVANGEWPLQSAGAENDAREPA